MTSDPPNAAKPARGTRQRTRNAMWHRQKGRCYLCGRKMTRMQKVELWSGKFASAVVSNTDATVDHRVPVSRGGSNGRGNKALACNRCNLLKGTMTEVEFRSQWYCFPEDPTFDPEVHLPALPEPFRKRKKKAEAKLMSRLREALGEV